MNPVCEIKIVFAGNLLLFSSSKCFVWGLVLSGENTFVTILNNTEEGTTVLGFK